MGVLGVLRGLGCTRSGFRGLRFAVSEDVFGVARPRPSLTLHLPKLSLIINEMAWLSVSVFNPTRPTLNRFASLTLNRKP